MFLIVVFLIKKVCTSSTYQLSVVKSLQIVHVPWMWTVGARGRLGPRFVLRNFLLLHVIVPIGGPVTRYRGKLKIPSNGDRENRLLLWSVAVEGDLPL